MTLAIFWPGQLAEGTWADVIRVIDGDTIIVHREDNYRLDRVRLIGANAPEMKPTAYCGAQMSTDWLSSHITGYKVYLEPGVVDRDRYGRYLAYVWLLTVDSFVLVNWETIRYGYASPMIVPPNDKYQRLFRDAYDDAYRNHLGIHERCRV